MLNLHYPALMGVLNVTPDSFSDGGKFFSPEVAVTHAKKMVASGAEIIDIGGESTRPGAQPISAEEELRRVLPVIEALVSEIRVPFSIDTMKPEVAEEAFKRGVHVLNDISGLRDERMRKVAAKYNVPVVIMHMQGTPETMQLSPSYGNVVAEIKRYLAAQARFAKESGIEQIIIDPGIGFGKTVEHNLTIIKHLAEFKELGYPLLIGPSRKGFIGKILNREVNQRLAGTLAVVTACVLSGADIIRTHDVKECKDAMIIANTIKNHLM
ncbi:MAG: dihydropteroate synthase [Parcubacteria group bacterium Gr01-1014_66]|nr:MAG: dihydropteroate synthase [Parcubacteria group bacterium Gr01-1014_66]